MSIGSYIDTGSVIHRIWPSAKLFLLVGISSAIFFVQDWRAMLIFLISAMVLYKIAGIKNTDIIKQMRPVLLLAFIIFIFQLVIRDWQVAILVAGRLIVLLLIASLVTITTPMSAMIETLERALIWLKYVGVNPARVSLAISLALRFIPVIATITGEVREAQKARGLERSIIAVAVPVIVRTLKAADDIADAIECRSFD